MAAMAFWARLRQSREHTSQFKPCASNCVPCCVALFCEGRRGERRKRSLEGRESMALDVENEIITIGKRRVGKGEPCLIIAEAGVNHNGSLEFARALVDVAVDAGCDAVKFQTFRA